MRHSQKAIAIAERSSVGEARRRAVAMAQLLGFDEGRLSNVGIVATELANNILLHGGGGELLICPVTTDGEASLGLLALDGGHGIADIGRAMEDGFSSGGSAGEGLGAISRLSDSSSLFSALGKGTALWSHFGPSSPIGVVNIPLAEEVVAGDSYLVRSEGNRSVYLVVDGLGHGPGAAEAAHEAVRTVEQCLGSTATEMMLRTHDALKKTRGAAMSVAIVDRERATLTYAGIGNVSALLLTGGTSRGLVSQNGTLGAVLPRAPQETTLPLERGTMLVMFSDGLVSKTSPSGYAGYAAKPPMLLAGLMYRDFSRRRDDASVLVARPGGERG